VLGRAYWLAVNRTASPNLYAYSDGGYLPQQASEQPYAHWSWWYPRAAGIQDNNCVRAAGDSAYEHFIGDTTIAAQLSDPAYFIITGSSRKYGWTPVQCASLNAYVCEIKVANMPCPSPPPTPPPDAPPPGTPLAPKVVNSACVPEPNATLFCSEGWCYSYHSAGLIFPKAQEACR
jgi:hypothetical protein